MGAGGIDGQDEVEQLKRLVEIQSQIVELARRNEFAARECETLREELARAASRRARVCAGQPTGVRRLVRRIVGAVATLFAMVLPPRMGG